MELELPEQLLQNPRCLVMLTGLDVRNNAVHRIVWDTFNSRKGDRKPVAYAHVRADHLYPRRGPERPPGEEPMPNGILKKNWLAKHFQELPAVVVFFFDLEWMDPQWTEKMTECASKMKVIRSALEGHHTELCLTLIHSTKPTQTDAQVTEQANQLCVACNIPAPNLYAMPFVERPEGYIIRLESSFYELALRYYSGRIRRIKLMRDVTTKPQLYLAIRRQFKIACFTEFSNPKESLKLYLAVYKTVIESMSLSEDRIMEFKVLAGYINYKVCRLLFEHDDPRQALNQFQKHVDHFRFEPGLESLAFQHLGWLANQYSTFGDLFAEAVRRSLTPVMTMHPGIHYYQSAQHQLERRRLRKSFCLDDVPSDSSLLNVDYIGQRPWRKGLSDLSASDSDLRLKCISLLQAQDLKVDLSFRITVPLTKALEYFNMFKADHMSKNIKELLGHEYYITKDYEKSLKLMAQVVGAYRKQRWWKLLGGVLDTMLRCSYVLADVKCFVMVALEMISRFISLPEVEARKWIVQESLELVLKGQAPIPEEPVPENQAGTHPTVQLWEKALQGSKEEKTIDVTSLATCIECKSVFDEDSCPTDTPMGLSVYLRSSTPKPLTITGLRVVFDQKSCDQWCVMEKEVTLLPAKYQRFSFSFPITMDMIKVEAVKVFLGPRDHSYVLVWYGGVSVPFSSPKDWAWNKIRNRTTAIGLQRDSIVKIHCHHNSPALINEFYPVTVKVENTEERELENLSVTVVCLPEHHKSRRTFSEDVRLPLQLFSVLPDPTSPQTEPTHAVEFHCQRLPVGQEFTSKVYVRSLAIGARTITVSATYSVYCTVKDEWEAVQCFCEKEETISLETVNPLRVHSRLMNMRFLPVDCLFLDEPFILMTEVQCLSPWKLHLDQAKHHWGKNITIASQFAPQLNGLDLNQQDIANECQCLVVPSASHVSTSEVPLGSFSIHWKRSDTESGIAIVTTVALPQVQLKQLPFSVTAEVPPYAVQNKPLTLHYKVKNRTVYVQEFEAQLKSSTDFMLSGKKSSRFRVLPRSTVTLSHNLVPLTVGHVGLPRFEVACISQPKLDEKILRGVLANLPTGIFVKPSAAFRQSATLQSSQSMPSSDSLKPPPALTLAASI